MLTMPTQINYDEFVTLEKDVAECHKTLTKSYIANYMNDHPAPHHVYNTSRFDLANTLNIDKLLDPAWIHNETDRLQFKCHLAEKLYQDGHIQYDPKGRLMYGLVDHNGMVSTSITHDEKLPKDFFRTLFASKKTNDLRKDPNTSFNDILDYIIKEYRLSLDVKCKCTINTITNYMHEELKKANTTNSYKKYQYTQTLLDVAENYLDEEYIIKAAQHHPTYEPMSVQQVKSLLNNHYKPEKHIKDPVQRNAFVRNIAEAFINNRQYKITDVENYYALYENENYITKSRIETTLRGMLENLIELPEGASIIEKQLGVESALDELLDLALGNGQITYYISTSDLTKLFKSQLITIQQTY